MSQSEIVQPAADRSTRPGRPGRTGYVLKMYPRFSETFIVTEILGREAAGEQLEVLSLRSPVDPRFHESLGRVRAPVTYIDRPHRPAQWWEAMQVGLRELPGHAEHLGALLAADADTAVQAVAVAAHARRVGLTHLHAHFATVAADVAHLASRLAGIGFSVTAHAKDLFHSSVSHDHLRELFAAATHVVTVSDYNVRWIEQNIGTGTVHRVYNGIDLTTFGYLAPPPDPGSRRIAAIGRLVEKKGFDVLIEAVGVLRDRGRPVHLDLAGGGACEPALRALISALRLEDQVSLHGPLAQHEIVALLRGARVLAAPCVVGSDGNADGLPTVLLEAMALGVPCVATDVTGVGEAVRNFDTGLLVQQRDVEGLADAIDRLCTDPVLARRCAQSARTLVCQQFDIRKQSRRLTALQQQSTAVAGAV